MGFGIENPFIKINFMGVCKKEVKIFECLPKEKGLHHVLGPGVERVFDVVDCCVASVHLGITLNPLNN